MCSQKRSNLIKQVPLLDLPREYEEIKGEIDEALLKTVSSARYILGPEVEQLEAELARYLGVKYCVGVASGTDALLLSLRALAITRKKSEFFAPDDERITTPFTFTATGSAILRAGARPVFVDIDPATYINEMEISGKHFRSVELSAELLQRVDLVVIATDHSRVDYRWLVRYARKILDTRAAV